MSLPVSYNIWNHVVIEHWDNLCIHTARPYPQDVVPNGRPSKVYVKVGEAVPDPHQAVLLDLGASVGTVLG